MDFICKTATTCLDMALLHDNFKHILDCNSRVLASTNWWNYHYSNIYSDDAKFSEFIPRNQSLSLLLIGHGRGAGEIVHDFFIWPAGGHCWISMFLWIVFSFGFVSHSCFEDWNRFSKQKVFMKIDLQMYDCNHIYLSKKI